MPDAPPNHLRKAFAEEEEAGFRLAARLRFAAISLVAVWVTIENGFPDAVFFYFFLAGFVALGLIPLRMRNQGRYRSWHAYLFPFLDCLLAVVAILAPNPFDTTVLPRPMDLRFGNEVYLFLFLALATLSYSPRVVLWTGAAAASAWSLGVLWIFSLPGTLPEPAAEVWNSLDHAGRLEAILNPYRVLYGPWGHLILVLFVMSAVLATAVQRSRRLVIREADAERGRANLARHFSANLVEKLADSDEPVGATRAQDVAIMFADVVGFTDFSNRSEPAEVIEFLRQFHVRVEDAVFSHDGTLDKYIGDGVMLSFGTPVRGDHDATNALRCARALLASVDEWNAELARTGRPSVRIGIGLHYGPVIAGDVGGRERLEYTVVGDTVNVASRIEHLTREVGSPLVVSEELLTAVRKEGIAADGDFDGLVELPPRNLRGREGAMTVFALESGEEGAGVGPARVLARPESGAIRRVLRRSL